MTNIIKVRFFKGLIPTGREYTYYTPEPVKVGDMVDIDTDHGKNTAIVTQVDVPEAEMAPFKDRAKTIIGKTILLCEYCENFIPIGEGDHICDEEPTKMPVSAYQPTEDYYWCKGAYFVDTRED